ncbi:MAG: DinB family protein [Ramlibacter sp.]
MEPDPVANYRFLARYNAWFNQRLYDACERLSDEERKRDRGAFFGSIHNTLNHLVWGDQLWLGRFASQPGCDPAGLLDARLLALPPGSAGVHESVLHADWQPLRTQRQQLDAAIEAWLAAMPAGFPASTMRYANTKGVQREHPAWMAITHLFSHQTHHRGQVTALLMQAGVDPGLTDLIALAMPHSPVPDRQ